MCVAVLSGHSTQHTGDLPADSWGPGTVHAVEWSDVCVVCVRGPVCEGSGAC